MSKTQVVVHFNGTEVTVRLSSSSVATVIIDEAEFTIKPTQPKPEKPVQTGSPYMFIDEEPV